MSWGAPPGGGWGQQPGGPHQGGYPIGPPGYPPQQPGYGGGPPAPMYAAPGTQIANPAAIQERSGAVVILLTFVTCGIYFLYWIYKTSDELRIALGDESISPGTDLLLSIITCGFWSLYVEYRNCEKVHLALIAVDPYHQNQATTVLMMNLLAFAVGFTNFVAIYLAQEEYNKLLRAARGMQPRGYY